ncbi:calumenin [Eurytemora carolleeae]|uniref:calumenin n=1 Tax=Eurytemora carolleeae TaxID=1294199 RepID=UPI000C786179|nr:calumenin [Eurytemora carolleeae]|eukprot:XP_023347335.1 calumenin-like [Eurytemora affinis]
MLSLSLLTQFLIFTACTHAASLDKDFVRSDSRIIRGRPLSDTARREDDGFDYDHDAFLGDDLSSQFDALSPEESLRRLKIILGRIDSNGDGYG